jgi:predicted Zn-dependent protease
MMSAERWDRLKDLFEAALALLAPQRASFIEEACRGDPELKAELQELVANHEALGRFLSGSSPGPDYTLPAGATLGKRFRVVRPLGKGGMGEVYEAFDQELQELLALKILRPELALNSESVTRLIQEIQLARKVTHRNVCRVFDLNRGTHEGRSIVFITMELLAGETLAERLRRDGPLDAVTAAEIATQIAAGIDAAHAAGIIHRDFKSANVMLVRLEGNTTRVVVMDFGLARNVACNRPALTAPGMIAGTPAYMAPEQLAGEAASRASDIYAFGLVLAEMRAGELEPEWKTAVTRCLERQPSKRPLSAGAAIGPISRRAGEDSRWIAVACLIALAVIVALFAGTLRFLKGRSTVHEGAQLMLADVVNSTGDPQIAGVGVELRRELAQSAYFNLWDDDRRRAVLQQMGRPADTALSGEVARETALRDGVPYVLFGTVAPLGDGFAIDLRLEELEPHSIFSGRHWVFSTPAGTRAAMHDAVHDASRWVRSTMGESSKDLIASDRPPQDITTTSWEALTLYAEAEQARTRNSQDEAVTLLRRSVALDSHFALGYMRLGDLLLTMHQQGEGIRAWEAAVAEASRLSLTRREELRIRGLFASEVQDYTNAEIAFSQLEREYPRDFLWSFYLGDALRWQGRFAEAAQRLDSALRKNPASVATMSNLASTLLLGNRLDELNRILQSLASSAPDLAAYYLGLRAFANEDYPGAIAALQTAAASKNPDRSNRANTGLACVLAELGRYSEARQVLEEGIRAATAAARPGARADKLLMMAYLDLRQNRRADLRGRCLEAVGVEDSPQRTARSAILLARAGYFDDARKFSQALTQFPVCPLITSAIQRINGELDLRQAHIASAVKFFEAANRVEPRVRLKDYLGRAYTASGNYAGGIAAFSRIANTPALLWETVDFDYPGILTDSLLDMAQCAESAHDRAGFARALELYARRRSAPDDGIPGAADVRRRLSNSWAPGN